MISYVNMRDRPELYQFPFNGVTPIREQIGKIESKRSTDGLTSPAERGIFIFQIELYRYQTLGDRPRALRISALITVSAGTNKRIRAVEANNPKTTVMVMGLRNCA